MPFVNMSSSSEGGYFGDGLALLGHYQANLGNREFALEYIARAQAVGPENMYVFYPSATALVILGQPDDAVKALERAVELGYPPELAEIDAGFREITQRPEFQKLVKATD
jgi:tetratricopeptide (TPR) repeat protein